MRRSQYKVGSLRSVYDQAGRSLSVAHDHTTCRSSVYPNCVEKPYRFMFEKLLDKAESEWPE